MRVYVQPEKAGPVTAGQLIVWLRDLPENTPVYLEFVEDETTYLGPVVKMGNPHVRSGKEISEVAVLARAEWGSGLILTNDFEWDWFKGLPRDGSQL